MSNKKVDGEGVYSAECIKAERFHRGRMEYLVKWEGWTQDHNTWEPKEHLYDERLFKQWTKDKAKRGRGGGARGRGRGRRPTVAQSSSDDDSDASDSCHHSDTSSGSETEGSPSANAELPETSGAGQLPQEAKAEKNCCADSAAAAVDDSDTDNDVPLNSARRRGRPPKADSRMAAARPSGAVARGRARGVRGAAAGRAGRLLKSARKDYWQLQRRQQQQNTAAMLLKRRSGQMGSRQGGSMGRLLGFARKRKSSHSGIRMVIRKPSDPSAEDACVVITEGADSDTSSLGAPAASSSEAPPPLVRKPWTPPDNLLDMMNTTVVTGFRTDDGKWIMMTERVSPDKALDYGSRKPCGYVSSSEETGSSSENENE